MNARPGRETRADKVNARPGTVDARTDVGKTELRKVKPYPRIVRKRPETEKKTKEENLAAVNDQ